MIVRELVTRLSFRNDFSALDAWTKRADTALDHVESRMQKLRRTKLTLGNIQSPRGGGAGSIEASFQAGIERALIRAFAFVQGSRLVKNFFETADNAQNLRARLSLMPQGSGDSAKDFDTMAQHANEIGVSLDSYGRTFARLGQSTKDQIKDQSKLLDITDALNKAIILGGATTAEAASTSLQFSQAIGSNNLAGEEFKALAENAPLLMRGLAEKLGIEYGQFKKAGSAGQLTNNRIIPAMLELKNTFDAQFAKLPLTVGRATQQVANRWELMIDRINRRTNFVRNVADLIVSTFDRVESAITAIVNASDGWGNAVRSFGALAAGILGVQLIKYLYTIRNLSWTAALPYFAWAAAVVLVGAAIEDLYVWIKGGDSVLGSWLGKWSDFKKDSALLAYIEGLGRALGGVAAIIVGIFSFNWSLIKEGIRGVIESAGQVGRAVEKGIFGNEESPDARAPMARMNAAKFMAKPGGDAAWMAAAAAANNAKTVNTTVNVTVPAGTTQEQAQFLKSSAAAAFGPKSDKLGSDLATYSN